MIVVLQVVLEVLSVDGNPLDPDQVAESTRQAIAHAIGYGQGLGHSHPMEDETSVILD